MALSGAERMRKLREKRSQDTAPVTSSQASQSPGGDGSLGVESSGPQRATGVQAPSTNGKVSDAQGTLPAGWRAEWRPPRALRDELPARARDRYEALPPLLELRQEMLRTLRSVATNASASPMARVAAAKAVLDVTEPKGAAEAAPNGELPPWLRPAEPAGKSAAQ